MTLSRFRTILYTTVAIVSLAGLADATYLAVQALTGETLGCGGFRGGLVVGRARAGSEESENN